MRHLPGDERTYPLDVVESVVARAGCHTDVGSDGQLVIQYHTQVSSQSEPGTPQSSLW